MLHEKHAFSATDISLYFYLLEVCNAANWVNPFRRNNAKILADLNLARNTFIRSRRKLKELGILNYSSAKGVANVTYKLADLETLYRGRNKAVTTAADTGNDTGCGLPSGLPFDPLNKNSKPKPKQVIVVPYANAFNFFVDTANCILLKQRYDIENEGVAAFFKTFYDSKIDLGDLNNKTIEEIARNFYYWLPKHLGATGKEKSCVKKESIRRPEAGKHQPLRGVAAAMKFATVKMRGEI
ncbi:hypothetical protein JN11_04866 [Mucilaginibacter frigoritolerans]|uniref:Helix-turn-helix protein n=2 Tax=Mucilaginibacter frigoritolerans TaxID=652788 RepID=A0A562TKG2_9SPHI|nr:hypothetical protein JN11_04866 [Mucilaginibacter frigoritolerans]